MPSGSFSNVRIAGVACAVPKTIKRIDDYVGQLGQVEVEAFKNNTGVIQRRTSHPKQTASDLCYEAAEALIKKNNVDRNGIGSIIFITQSPDYIMPATAHVLHKRLGLPKECAAFDINLGCSGFTYGVSIAASMITGGLTNNVLLCVGDVSGHRPETNIKDDMLFGDAGSAVYIEKGAGTIQSSLYSDGSGYTTLIVPGGGSRRRLKEGESYWDVVKYEMDGADVMAFAIREVPKAIKQFYQTFNCGPEDFDYYLLHQANLFMLNYIVKKLKVPSDKIPVSIDRYGNTNGSSIPVTLCDLCQREKLDSEIKFIAAGFGIGLSWGIASFTVDPQSILPIIETDAYFEEAYRG